MIVAPKDNWEEDEGSPGPTDEEVNRWSDSELAAHVRPVAFAQGFEYELVASDAEVISKLQKAKDYLRRHPELQEGREPTITSNSSSLEAQQIIDGTDGRVGIYTPTTYPYSAVGVSVSLNTNWNFQGGGSGACTFTMIGPSTAVTAAHCFYTSGVGWHAWKSWALGVRTLSGGSPIWDYGMYLASTWVTIPSGFMTSNTVYDDYAVIEFSNSQGPMCNLFPGYTTGWYGWADASLSEIESRASYMHGYPVEMPVAYVGTYEYPSLFTRSGSPGSVSRWLPLPGVLVHTHDTTGGDRGAAIVQNLAVGNNRVVGIHKGGLGSSLNWGRKIDSTVSSFIYTNSAL